MQKLDFRIVCRKEPEAGDLAAHARQICDFTIDDASLLDMLSDELEGHKDYVGCFVKNWKELNNHSLNQLLLKVSSETATGRRFLYVCPECADIGCGSIGCRITNKGRTYIWDDFAHENGYEQPKLLKDIGPFEFSSENYIAVIKAAFAI